MSRKLSVITFILITAWVWGALLLSEGLLAAPASPATTTAATDLAPTHWLTVTTTSDKGGMNERCETHSPCTLRRAVNEIRYHSFDDPKPVYHVAFDIPETDPGYDAVNGVWIIQLDSTQTNEPFIFRDFGSHGHVIIDGTTQPGGRDLADGPRIILRGDNRKGVFTLTGGRNVIRGLAFQGFGDNVISIPATNENLIEQNWFGLTTAGDAIYLRDPLRPEDGSGEGGIYAQKSGNNGISNTIQSNVLAGFKAVAISVQGDHNAVLSNTVGTRADGTAPDVRADRKCKPNARYNNWFPGAGIDIFGESNHVAYNRVVGLLFQSPDPANTPDDAISVTGRDHVVRDNIIGLTSDGVPFGTCGEGIQVGGASGAHFIEVRDNLIVGAHGAAGILVAAGELGYDLDAVTVQGNVILDSKMQAFDFSPNVPAALRLFNPAAVTQIDGVNVTGASGVDSLCAECLIEIFLDHHDSVTETLESLGTTTADASGAWSFTLTRTLALTEGLRTASTTVADGQISNATGTITYSAGTTTRISEIYTQAGAPEPEEPLPPTPEPPLPVVWPTYMAQPTAPTTFNTIITVTTAADPDDSMSYTCSRDLDGPPVPAPDGKCTLRRAIVEATALMAETPAARPVQIRFAIPITDTGYDAGLDVWVIQITDTLQLNALPTLGSTDVEKAGQVVIDGDTQPGGRATGPKIIVRGPQNRDLVGLVVNGNNNVIRGIVFQNFKTALQLNHSQNIIENNWFGLDNAGTDIAWRDADAPEQGSGLGGIKVAENTTQTLIQNNALAGFIGAAISMDGDDGFVLSNRVGTNANGAVPDVAWNRWCRPNARYFNWFGGAGVEVRGKRNQVISNRIAGLLWYSNDPENTPDTALEVKGQDHLIEDNVIGIDANDKEVGSCGRGLVVDAGFTRIINNVVVRTALEPFRMDGTQMSLNALYYEGNLSWDSTAPVYMEFGNQVPEARQLFTPSVVLSINVAGGSTTVSGAAHPDAPCPYCQVELFLDDLDPQIETRAAVAIVQADADGDWQTTLPFELGLDEGLRTASTAFNYGIIAHFDGPSTSRVSTEVYSRTGALLPDPPPDPLFPAPPVLPEVVYAEPPAPPANYVTVITVTNTSDAATPEVGAFRWAINQANALSAVQRPVLIAFDIPTSDAGYNAAGFWKITLSTTNLPIVKDGHVTIDGSTQPGGRADAPKIILFRDGASTAYHALRLGELVSEGAYIARGLAFQNVEVRMTGAGNIIEENWFGLSDDGTAIYFYNDDPAQDNHGFINGASAGGHNLVRDNKLAGSRQNAINFASDDNLIEGNTIGLLADGTIPDWPAEASFCKPDVTADNWFGGGGIKVSGRRNRILDNTIAGLLIQGSSTTTPPDAIWIPSGQDNLIDGNVIGQAADGAPLWTCGSAVDIGTRYTRILSNTIVNGARDGLFVNGNTIFINATTMQGNVISDTVPAIEFGDAVPESLKLFAPALVTLIDGVDVTGIADDPCPYCRIDVYLDDDDPDTEALVYLSSTFADGDGAWAFTLPAELDASEGLRTQSTTRDYGVIKHFEAGTSSKLSMLFEVQPPQAPVSITLTAPAGELWTGEDYTFVAEVYPVTTTLPITYVWEATGQDTITVTGGVQKAVVFNWTAGGEKTVSVTASNAYGSYSEQITVSVMQLTPLTGVSITGPVTGVIQQATTFEAIIAPSDATPPLTYTWTPDPQDGQGTGTATYQWDITGTHTLTVTVANYGGVFTATHQITLSDDAPVCYDLTGITIAGVISGAPGEYTFTTSFTPTEATPSIDYLWDNGDTTATTTRTLSLGTHTLVVTATNCMDAQVMDTHTVVISAPEVVTVTIEPGEATEDIIYTDTQGLAVRVQIPGSAISETTTFTYTHVATPTQPYAGLLFAGWAFDLEASTTLRAGAVLTATLRYDDDILAQAGIVDPTTLRLYYWHTGTTAWTDVAEVCDPPSTYHYDTDARTVEVAFCHLTSFGLMSPELEEPKLYLPLVTRNFDG